MKIRQQTITLTAALFSAVLLSSPAAFAGDKKTGEHRHDRGGDRAAMCERLERGDWEQKRGQFREKAQKHHEEVAARLQLTDEQREIWDDMQAERQQKYQRRFETLQERCKDLPEK